MSEVEIGAGDLRGRVIDRRFEIEDKLGEGGMGTIYRAKQLSMTRMVALKLYCATGMIDFGRTFQT